MKKLLLLCIPLALLYACGDKQHKTELVNDGGSDSLEITSVSDTFNKFKNSYYVKVMLKNTAKTKAEGFVVAAKYIDQVGDITSETSAGAGKTLAPGDSMLIENVNTYTTFKDLPYKVKVSARKMF